MRGNNYAVSKQKQEDRIIQRIDKLSSRRAKLPYLTANIMEHMIYKLQTQHNGGASRWFYHAGEILRP